MGDNKVIEVHWGEISGNGDKMCKIWHTKHWSLSEISVHVHDTSLVSEQMFHEAI